MFGTVMKRLGIGLLCAIGGYPIAAVAGYFLIEWFSSNMHDRSVEAAMTSAFVLGPLGAVLGFVVGFILGGRKFDRASAKR
jgi:MFS family permease